MCLQQEMQVLRCDVQTLRRQFGTPKHNEAPTESTPVSECPCPAPSGDGFTRVKGGSPPRPAKRRLPIITANRYSVLGPLQEDDSREIRLVGDSIVRGQLMEFCGRSPSSRKRYCTPGARVGDIADSIDDFTAGASGDTGYILHVGTNNVQSTRSEELLERYRTLLRSLKLRSEHIVISGILPRCRAGNSFYGKASYINNCMKVICEEEGVGFVNFWNDFYGQRDLFLPDGIHLNGVGAARFGRLLNKAATFFH